VLDVAQAAHDVAVRHALTRHAPHALGGVGDLLLARVAETDCHAGAVAAQQLNVGRRRAPAPLIVQISVNVSFSQC
jgi:hypothetical protein